MTDTTNTPEQDDFYDGAQSAFPSIEDLDGRLVAIWADSTDTRKGDSGMYPFVETDTMVLDDGEAGGVFTELVPSVYDGEDVVPLILEGFQHSTTGLVSRLKPRIGRKVTPLIGRVNSQPSKVNKRVLAYSIATPDENDMATARSLRSVIVAHTEARRAAKQKSEDTAAFE